MHPLLSDAAKRRSPARRRSMTSEVKTALHFGRRPIGEATDERRDVLNDIL
jgi:hypothetical protein